MLRIANRRPTAIFIEVAARTWDPVTGVADKRSTQPLCPDWSWIALALPAMVVV